MKTRNNLSRGISIVEVLVGLGILLIVGIFISVTVFQFSESRKTILEDINRVLLAEEAYEIIRYSRDIDWSLVSSLSLNVPHYLDLSTTTIAFTNTPELINNKFNRSFVLDSVYRNSSDEIVSSTTPSASIDVNSRALSIYVSSDSGTTTTQSLLMNFNPAP